jgi:hypothetical protein
VHSGQREKVCRRTTNNEQRTTNNEQADGGEPYAKDSDLYLVRGIGRRGLATMFNGVLVHDVIWGIGDGEPANLEDFDDFELQKTHIVELRKPTW